MKTGCCQILKFIGLAALYCAETGAHAQDYDVAAYVWPAYQPESRWAELGIFKAGKGEWQSVWEARPKWEGHEQPRRPLWGYTNEADPKDVAQKIAAAVSHGVNVFIYDWYWYCGRPFLEDALDKGFLGAPNNGTMKFFIMWANHDVDEGWNNTVADKSKNGWIWRGTADDKTFDGICDRWIAKYFVRPNYYRIQNRPVLMVYDTANLIKGFGGVEQTAAALNRFRAKCVTAGLNGLHFMVCDYQIKPEWVKPLGIDSATIYNLVHWSSPKGNPDYTPWAAKAAERFDGQRETGYPMYFPHASVGWDQNPRSPSSVTTETVIASTPAKFEVALRRAKDWVDRNATKGYPRLVTVNSWNEWTEGSYLEPDTKWGFGYLESIQKVFGSVAAGSVAK